MTLRQLLRDKREAIARSWLEGMLASYPENSAAIFAREKDRFANPVGHALRVGCEGILAAVIDGAGMEQIQQHLREVIKIRAVQQFAPSQAVGFIFGLKKVIRAELGAAADPQFSEELAALDAKVDLIALAAFDAYVGCRERVYELRLNEIKRQVSWIVGKVNRRDSDPELVQISRRRSHDGRNVGCEDLR